MEIEVRIKDGENVVDKEVMYIEEDAPSMYARIFDEVSPYGYGRMVLRDHEACG